ncbi:MAG: pectate lyase [Bacteroidales bacterium]|nr:pectate lyase [Bacteroidales bacterium]
MKHIVSISIVCALLLACTPDTGGQDKSKPASTIAFPGAEGGGQYTTGGRGGMVYHVTSLTDDPNDAGSLRHVLRIPGAKTIVFDVAGTIFLQRELDITEGALTIAGQSAPGDGICIAGYPVVIKTSNVIIRFLRFRMGDENKAEGDALTCTGRNRILIDHCSFSWSTDECVSCYGNTDFTLQYCFITESLRKSVHVKGTHGYGGIWGGKNATFHHNLLAHHDSRNPRFDHEYVDSKCHGPIDYVNNVIYNWGGNSAYGGDGVSEPRKINIVNNYYKPGPASRHKERIVAPTTRCDRCNELGTVVPGKFYITGNYMDGSATVTADNWKGVEPDEPAKLAACRADKPFAMPAITTQTAQEAYEIVLTKAGCSLVRDAIDTRIANEVRNGTYTCKGSNGSTNGLIDSQTDAGSWPEYQSAEKPRDTDGDGIPDEWETAHGLNPSLYTDAAQYTLSKEYTNIEVYLNSIVEHLY